MVRRPTSALTLVLLAACASGTTASPPTTGAPATTTTVAVTASPPFGDDVLLVWSPGGLPAGMADAMRALGDVAVALGDVVVGADGVPVEAAAFDCDGASALLPADVAVAVCGLDAGQALLGETAAGYLGDGSIALDAATFDVAGVVDDDAIGAAEIVLSPEGAVAAGVDTERYALLRHEGERADVEAAVRALAPDALLRVRAPGEVAVLRHADAVLPQSHVKARFGDGASEGWRAASIVADDLPVIGAVTCHRLVLPPLRGALAEIAERGLLAPVDRRASGCFNQRSIAGTTQPSRHSWGIAVDLVGPPITPEVVEVFARWGFTWGGDWLTPDPIHFEWVREPAR